MTYVGGAPERHKEITEKNNVTVGGIGCFSVFLGIALLLNFPRVLDLIELWIRTCK